MPHGEKYLEEKMETYGAMRKAQHAKDQRRDYFWLGCVTELPRKIHLWELSGLVVSKEK